MKKQILFLLLFALCSSQAFEQSLQSVERKRVVLPNGWSLTPVGKSLPLGDLPLNIAVSPKNHWVAVTNNGQSTQTIQLIDARSEKTTDSIVIAKSWLGLAFTSNGNTLYASGGNDNRILQYAIASNGKLSLTDSFPLGKPWPKEKISVAGITVDDSRGVLYAVSKESNSLYIVHLKTHAVEQPVALGAEGYTCILSPDKRLLYVSVWGGQRVRVFDTEKRQFTKSLVAGSHPNDLCLSSDGKLLFVANANDNTVSVIDVAKGKPLETLNAAIYPASLTGSTTNGVSLSADNKTLYVANADNNCLAVFDVSRPGSSTSLGFIPVGWYPTCVRTVGSKLYVANGKGFSSFPNPNGPNPAATAQTVTLHQGETSAPKVQYIGGGLLIGTMSIIAAPSRSALSVYSQAVIRNTPYQKRHELELSQEEPGNPVPRTVGDSSPIKYVFYIIKENRTYDQVLSDLPKGNGDTSLLLFGRQITPNQHAVAEQFVLLDHFFVDGEVSSDGHNWSMGAYATDYLEKNWPTSYGRRGGGEISSGRHPLGTSKSGFIWDQASRFGVSYRTYGEFADHQTPNIPVLENHLCRNFNSLDMHILDTVRERQWEADFDSLVAVDSLPRLNTVRFGNDHTEGMKAGRPTPFAHVADNDIAVGRFIEHLSRSRVWNESVVFVVEDDAQNGPDHVDAHRTTAYIAGGFVKRGFVDHTMYTTTSMLRTMELILGIPPMTQYDAGATPMYASFMSHADSTSFRSLPCTVNLSDVNPDHTGLSAISANLDFNKEDVVPDEIMNSLLWKGIRGETAVVPTPVRAAFFKAHEKKSSQKDFDD